MYIGLVTVSCPLDAIRSECCSHAELSEANV